MPSNREFAQRMAAEAWLPASLDELVDKRVRQCITECVVAARADAEQRGFERAREMAAAWCEERREIALSSFRADADTEHEYAIALYDFVARAIRAIPYAEADMKHEPIADAYYAGKPVAAPCQIDGCQYGAQDERLLLLGAEIKALRDEADKRQAAFEAMRGALQYARDHHHTCGGGPLPCYVCEKSDSALALAAEAEKP